MIHNRMGVKTVVSHSRYLGFSIVIGRSKKKVFSLMVERIWKKVKGWKEGFLSRAGKEVLIKAVAQVFPSYIVSCYRIPTEVCNEIERILAKFWWGAKDGERKIHWLSWENLAKAKCFGGVPVGESRYFSNYNILEAKVGYAPNYAWRSVFAAKELVMEGSRWRIGDGSKVYVWKDNWIPSNSGFKCLSDPKDADLGMKVCDLIIHELGCWNRELVENIFRPGEAK
ncbi:unnamed protein product [Vicia faba]|nr:unnamed protein product [Vicia faba]